MPKPIMTFARTALAAAIIIAFPLTSTIAHAKPKKTQPRGTTYLVWKFQMVAIKTAAPSAKPNPTPTLTASSPLHVASAPAASHARH